MGFSKYSDGGAKPKKKDNGGFLSDVARNIRDVAAGIPRVPSGIKHELQLLTGMAVPEIPVPSGLPRDEARKRADASRRSRQKALDLERRQIAEGVNRAVGREKVAKTFELPGVRMVPLAYIAANLARGDAEELKDNPVFTALDALPVLNKASKTLTKGTPLALEAAGEAAQKAESAAAAGKSFRASQASAKAERFAKEGLNLRQATKAALKRTSRKVAEKSPAYERINPERLLEQSGLGGERLRDIMQDTAIQERSLRQGVDEFAKEALGSGPVNRIMSKVWREEVPGVAKKLGISDERVRTLTDEMRMGQPGWLDNLPEPEQQLVRWAETKNLENVGRGLKEGKLLTWADEVFHTSESPSLTKAVRAHEKAIAKANAAQALIDAGQPLPKNVRLPAVYLQEAEAAAQLADKVVRRFAPDRFKPLIKQQAIERTLANGDLATRIPDWAGVEELLRGGHVEFTPGEVQRVVKLNAARIRRTWQQLREAGHDPIFVHEVDPRRAQRIANPRLSAERIKTPSAFKRRGWNWTESVNDVRVALSHQEMEWLSREHAKALLDDWTKRGILKTAPAAMEDVLARARQGFGRGATVGERADYLLKRDFDRFDPEQLIPIKEARGEGLLKRKPGEPEPLLIPKGIGRAIANAAPPDFAGLRALAEVPGKVFRTSILTLNPLYYIDNIVSGAVLTSMTAGPSALGFKNLARAFRTLRDGTIDPALGRGATRSSAEQTMAVMKFQTGRTLFRLLEEQKPSNWAKIRDGAGRLIHGAEGFANFIDDMYKTAAYLKGEAKAIGKGLSPEEARWAGVELAAKTLMSFDRKTPFERTAIRSVFPFYGWSQFILGHTFQLPFDHPVRIAILGSLARAEMADWPSGLPERFKDYFVFNVGDKQYGLTISGWNPYQSVADYWTFAGIASRIDPRLQGALKMYGVDDWTQGPDLYADMHYDFVSGGPALTRPSAPRTALETFIPQAGVAAELAIPTEDLIRLKEENPSAYIRMIASRFGIRMPKELDIEKEIAKARKAERRAEEQERQRARPRSSSGSGGFSKYS